MISGSLAKASSSENSTDHSTVQEFREKLREGKTGKLGTSYYWDQGFNVVSPKENFKLRVGGRMGLDMGYVGSSGDVSEAFSSLDDFDPDFRRLDVSVYATLYKAVDFKLEIDFANVKTIRDIWVRYTKNPFLSHFTLGHIKEPFSLERLISSKNITFMERALPVNALSLGRNMGIKFNDTAFDDQVTFAGGFFWNTGSLHEVSNPQDSISDANGYNITARITGLAWYYDEGRRLLHLGLGYSRGTRDSGEDGAMRLSALPESYIADTALVDTEEFFVDSNHYITTELATVEGPISFQSEITYYSGDSDEGGDLDFWGFYLYVSYFLTGEHREYDNSTGIFSSVHPKQNFNLRERKWGAWEIGFRHSFVDLNDKSIEGGKERNFTLAINWYFKSKIRLMFNYVRADVEDRDNNHVVDDGSANIFQTRFQIHF